MKFFLGLSIFIFALVISSKTLANESAPAAAHGKGEAKPERDNTALFPPKKADKSMTTRPEKPELLEPAAMSEVKGDKVTLKWKEGTGATSFHLQVATDPNFKWIVQERMIDEKQKLFTETSFELTDLKPDQHYYWRVASLRTSNNAGYVKGEFSKSMFETPASAAK